MVLAFLASVIALFVPVISDQSDNFAMLKLDVLHGKLDELVKKVSLQFGTSQAVVEDIIKEVDIQETISDGFDVGFVPK